jgi:putative hydrolase of the HAD superfamily
MKQIKAIIFDMGGVLMDLDIEDCKAAFKSMLGFEAIDSLIDPCHQKGIYGDLEGGVLSADEFRSLVLAESRPGSALELVDQAMWHILVGVSPYKAELLNRLAESYDLYLLSNNNPICMPRSRQIFEEAGAPVDRVFRKCFLSHEMKVLKPEERFYKSVMEQIGLPAENMIFIDDSQKNVDGAEAAGLPAVYYEPGSDLSQFMAEVLGCPEFKMEGVC